MVTKYRPLICALKIESKKELRELISDQKIELQKVAVDVILHNYSYEYAGKKVGITKAAVYNFFKRLYKKKYGVNYYGKRNSITKDT